MAGDWIKIEHTTSDKPEVFRIAEILHVDPDLIVGKLVRFWSWCDQQTVNGNSLGVPDSVIDRVTHQPGFSAALREVSWLQARSGSLVIPNFDRHNGQTAKARAMDNRKKSNQRSEIRELSRFCPENVPMTTGQKPGPEKRREEKRREEIIPKTVGETLPGMLAPADEPAGKPEPECAAGAAPASAALSDGDWLSGLVVDPAYAGIDVRHEHAKAIRWATENRKQMSRKRFVNWLNRCDRPLGAVTRDEFGSVRTNKF